MTSPTTQIPVATKKGFSLNFSNKFNYSGQTNPAVVLAHEIGHATAFLQNQSIKEATVTMFASGDGNCTPTYGAGWRDHAKLVDCAEYFVSGCVFESLYQKDLTVDELYQIWLNCPHARGDRAEFNKEFKRFSAEKTEELTRKAIATSKTRFSQLGVDYINQLINQASVQKGNKVLTLVRP